MPNAARSGFFSFDKLLASFLFRRAIESLGGCRMRKGTDTGSLRVRVSLRGRGSSIVHGWPCDRLTQTSCHIGFSRKIAKLNMFCAAIEVGFCKRKQFQLISISLRYVLSFALQTLAGRQAVLRVSNLWWRGAKIRGIGLKNRMLCWERSFCRIDQNRQIRVKAPF